jgi:hypothetical protein
MPRADREGQSVTVASGISVSFSIPSNSVSLLVQWKIYLLFTKYHLCAALLELAVLIPQVPQSSGQFQNNIGGQWLTLQPIPIQQHQYKTTGTKKNKREIVQRKIIAFRGKYGYNKTREGINNTDITHKQQT